MISRLWVKFLLLLVVIAIVGLSASFLLRELMIRDFREFSEGERIDRIYWITAAFESSYAKSGEWHVETLADTFAWGLMLGFEIRLFDAAGSEVTDSKKALQNLSPLAEKRIRATSEKQLLANREPFMPYNLFLAGREIGHIEVRSLYSGKEVLFISRANRFLLWTVVALGGAALVLSALFAGRMTRPINNLTEAAADIAEGNLKRRVDIAGEDEISRLINTFNRMAGKLEIQEQLRKKLTSNIAHELRTPLTAVRGELEGMIDGYIRPDRESIQSLYDETGRLKRILDGIEELSMAEASSLHLRKERVELKAMFSNVVQRFSAVMQEKGIAYQIRCEDDIAVHADPDRLSQMLINLLSNAVKAAGKGGKITLEATKDAPWIHVRVHDTGSGIQADDLPHIFERFFRGKEGGLGLGLTIVKELAEAHGGKVSAISEPGRGSTFTVSLPA